METIVEPCKSCKGTTSPCPADPSREPSERCKRVAADRSMVVDVITSALNDGANISIEYCRLNDQEQATIRIEPTNKEGK